MDPFENKTLIPADKILLLSVMRHLCHKFGDLEVMPVSLDYSGKDRDFSVSLISSLYRVAHDLLHHLTSVFIRGHIRLQVIETSYGVILLVAIDQNHHQFAIDSNQINGVVERIESLQQGIKVNLSSQGGLTIVIDLRDDSTPVISSHSGPIRLLIADDHKAMREGLKLLLQSIDTIAVTGEVCNGQEAIDTVSKGAVDLVLMDINMPGINGIEATKYITTKFPEVKVVAISTHLEDSYFYDMIAAGAMGYISKPCHKTTLVAAIANAVSGTRLRLN